MAERRPNGLEVVLSASTQFGQRPEREEEWSQSVLELTLWSATNLVDGVEDEARLRHVAPIAHLLVSMRQIGELASAGVVCELWVVHVALVCSLDALDQAAPEWASIAGRVVRDEVFLMEFAGDASDLVVLQRPNQLDDVMSAEESVGKESVVVLMDL